MYYYNKNICTNRTSIKIIVKYSCDLINKKCIHLIIIMSLFVFKNIISIFFSTHILMYIEMKCTNKFSIVNMHTMFNVWYCMHASAVMYVRHDSKMCAFEMYTIIIQIKNRTVNVRLYD